MLLARQDVNDVRQMLGDGRSAELEQLEISGVSLGAALELACCGWELLERGSPLANTGFLASLRRRFPILVRAHALLREPRPCGPRASEKLFASPEAELCAVHGGSLESSDWHLFLQRFSRTLRRQGLGGRFSDAFAGAFGEMADNVVQHGAERGQPTPRGLAGFHVTERQAAFAVVDIGRGMLRSLHENPLWKHLDDQTEALEAVIRQRATRRSEHQHGDGFTQLFNSLIDHAGNVSLRSGDTYARLGGDARKAGRTLDVEFGVAAAGVAVVVICAWLGEPTEESLPQEENA